MNQRAEYLLRVLETIGTPLMASILRAPGRSAGDETQKDAQRMAELLAKTTQASIDMAQAIDLAAMPDGGDSVRVSLAALAGTLVGALYQQTGKSPGENDLRKITAALQTVLAYSENFVPGAETNTRLDTLAAMGQPADPQQTTLQYIHAFIPVISAVTSFPFGQPEQKLATDIATRLMQKTMELRESLFPSAPAAEQKRAELALLAALTKIYAACHEAETARLMALPEDQRGAGSGIEAVWKTFELRAGILEALARSMVPGEGTRTASSGSKAPVAPEKQAPAQQAAPAVPPAAPAGGSPLSNFVKKPATEASAPPPAVPPPALPPSSGPQNPPSAPNSTGGNPMSFFKAPPKKE